MNAPINTAVLARDARNIGLTPISGCPTPDALSSVVAAWNAFRKEGGNWRDAVGFAANSEGHVWVVVNPGANTGFDLWDFISKDIAAQWGDITKYLARNKRKPLLDAPSPASISDLVVDIPIQTFPACAPANLIAAYGGPAPQEPMQPAPMPVMEPEPEPVMPPQPEPMPVVEPEPVMPPQPAPVTYSDADELTGFLDEEADTSQWVLRNLVTGETYPVPTHPAIIGRSPTSSEIPVGHGDAKRVISRHHARLDINPQRGTITITDLGSTNKTKLGSHVLSPNVPVETSLPVHSLLLGDIPFEIMEEM